MSRTDFGAQLRDWRRAKGLSQLELAARAEVSQRHVSFIETGRSRPSREMVIHLGLVLDVPPREQNLLLLSAGHAPAFNETPLDDLEHIAGVLDFILQAHQPNIAIVVDRQWNLIRANAAATRFISTLFPDPTPWMTPPINVMRLNFHPDGIRRHMVDWESSAIGLLRRLERDVASHPNDPDLRDLLDEVRAYPGVGALRRGLPTARAGDLLVPVTYAIDGQQISMFTTIATIGEAHDLTLAELRLETFWPVDETSARRWKMLQA
jgi:transcriptional regulator with XRE-family HTH domain